jgi:opacity protein-like surface antigen
MKTKLIVISTALAAAALAAPAYAQSKAGFEPGFYVGLGFGQSHVSGGNNAVVVGGTTFVASGFDSNKTTFQVNGGYQFTEMWGLEVQYTDGGSRSGVITNTATGATIGTPSIKAYQWGISGTGTYMFDEAWFARGKLGVSSNHIDNFTVAVPGGAVGVGGGSKTDLLAGIGVGYKWNANFSTRLEYEYFGKFASNNGTSSNGTASNLGLRMQYKF